MSFEQETADEWPMVSVAQFNKYIGYSGLQIFAKLTVVFFEEMVLTFALQSLTMIRSILKNSDDLTVSMHKLRIDICTLKDSKLVYS